MERMFSKTKKVNKEQSTDAENGKIEYADYEFFRKSKVNKCLESGEEFFVLDMEKKRVYSSYDLRLKDLSEKLEKENVYVFKAARYS